MADIISRKDVLDEIFILEFFYSHHDVIRKFCGRLNASIGKIPAVDAVEVVRCKDCKYCRKSTCQLTGFMRSGECFCNFGERKENE